MAVNNVVWHGRRYFFRMSEAYNIHDLFCAGMYMRPRTIWLMEYALEKK